MFTPRFELTGVPSTLRLSPGKFGKVLFHFHILKAKKFLGIFLPGYCHYKK